MIRNTIILIATILSVCVLARGGSVPPTFVKFNIRELGAAGDGKSNDTASFQKALDLAGKATVQSRDIHGQVIIPAGNYLIGSIVMPAGSSIVFEKDAVLTASTDIADYPIVQSRWEGQFLPCHRALISAADADDISITGPGKIVGPDSLGPLRNPRAPVLMEFNHCDGVTLDGFSTSYSRMWSIHPIFCANFKASNLAIRSTPNLSNGDGVDVDSSKNVTIDNCNFDTGDDCIALKSGKGLDIAHSNQSTQNVRITNCAFSSNFAGIAFGTELSGGIRNITISDCKFTRGANALFFKSRPDRGGTIADVSADNLDISCTVFIGIDLVTKGIAATQPFVGEEGYTHVSNLKFSNVRLNCRTFVDGKQISDKAPLDGLTISSVAGRVTNGISLSNVNHAVFDEINVYCAAGNLLNLTNVQINPAR